MATERKITGKEHEIHYILERKPVRNINLRIRRDGKVYVSANSLVPIEKIDGFVAGKEEYIFASLEKFSKLEENFSKPRQLVSGESFTLLGKELRLRVKMYPKEEVYSDGTFLYLHVRNPFDLRRKDRVLSQFIGQQCEKVFGEVISRIYPIFEKYGVAFPEIRIRAMTSRWGSCMPRKRVVTLNAYLIKAPLSCIEYVVMHEFCHFLHPDHSKHFHALMATLMPDYKERKKTLEETASVCW